MKKYKMPSRKELLKERKKANREKKLLVAVSASVFVPEPEPEHVAPPPEPEPEPEPVNETCDRCIYIIGRGKRKGQECGKKCKEGLYCSLHIEKSLSD